MSSFHILKSLRLAKYQLSLKTKKLTVLVGYKITGGHIFSLVQMMNQSILSRYILNSLSFPSKRAFNNHNNLFNRRQKFVKALTSCLEFFLIHVLSNSVTSFFRPFGWIHLSLLLGKVKVLDRNIPMSFRGKPLVWQLVV